MKDRLTRKAGIGNYRGVGKGGKLGLAPGGMVVDGRLAGSCIIGAVRWISYPPLPTWLGSDAGMALMLDRPGAEFTTGMA